MFETRLVASLSQLGISILARANSLYNMSLLLFSLSSNQPPAKKATWRKKGKRIRHMKKRKETENGNTPGSDEVKNCISNHCTLLGAQPSSWRELRTMKGPLCMNAALRLHRQGRAQGKLMEPDLWSRLCISRERWFFQTANALAKKARPYLVFKYTKFYYLISGSQLCQNQKLQSVFSFVSTVVEWLIQTERSSTICFVWLVCTWDT